MGNGVRHTEKINSYTKNLTKKKFGSFIFRTLLVQQYFLFRK